MSDNDEPEPSGLDGLPPMFSIAKGEVVSVQTYGAFVRLPGYKKEGGPSQYQDAMQDKTTVSTMSSETTGSSGAICVPPFYLVQFVRIYF